MGVRNILAAADGIGDGGTTVPRASGKAPERLAGARVEGEKVSFGVAAKDQVAGGREDGREQPGGGGDAPMPLAGDRIECGKIALLLRRWAGAS